MQIDPLALPRQHATSGLLVLLADAGLLHAGRLAALLDRVAQPERPAPGSRWLPPETER